MKTRNIKTKNYFLRNCNQATIEQIINGRIYHNKFGWINIRISKELKDSIINDIKNYFDIPNIKETSDTFKHWSLRRMWYVNYGNGIKLDYATGQDYISESIQIRRHFKTS